MSLFEVVIFGIIIFLIGWAIITFLKDPILMFKSFLRYLKTGTISLTILTFPVWGIFWIIDRVFILGIFYETVEKTSKPFEIVFSKYEKFLVLNETDSVSISNLIGQFHQCFDKEEYNFDISNTNFAVSSNEKDSVLKLTGIIEFETFKHLINFLSNSKNGKTLYSPIGILINKESLDNSFFLYSDWNYEFELIGRSKKGNRKIYSKLDIGDSEQSVDKVFYNSNVEISKRFNFMKFIDRVESARFKELKILYNL
jgi:hypothetical protein